MSGICGIVFPDVYQPAPPLSPLQDADSEELILTSYDVWGCEFLKQIDGDFALAILDQKRDELILARDRTGRKPLYWYQHQQNFLFASELKAIMASGLVPQNPSENAIASYLFFGFTPQDSTPVTGVTRLLPGHYLRLHLNHNKSIHSYWAYSSYFRPNEEEHEDTNKQLEEILLSSLKTRLPSPEKKASCIVGGGLGSASVAYYLQSIRKPTKGFTCAFEKETEEDIEIARSICNTLQIEHSSCVVGPSALLKDLPAILWHLDEPLADPNVVITWKLAEATSQYGPYTFSGMGADEILAGHTRFMLSEKNPSATVMATELLKPIVKTLFLQPALWLWPKMGFRFMRRYPTNPLQAQYLNENALFDVASARKAAPAIADLFDLDIFLHRFYNISRTGSNMDSVLYLDVKTRLADLYMLQYDRLTACHQLHWSSPYLSREILEFAAPLPRGGLHTDLNESLLTSMLRDVFPPEVVNRKKISRPHLLENWIDHPEIHEAFSLLEEGTLIGGGMISKDWLHSLLESHRNRKGNSFMRLWSILCLEIWYRLYIDQPVRTSAPDVTTLEFLQTKR
jgi:asparagine synthase (glutamine-hydrolysing)